MGTSRRLLLMVGPVLLIGLCYAVAAPSRDHRRPVEPALRQPLPDQTALVSACELRRRELLGRLEGDWQTLVRPPFVVLSDLPPDRLQDLFDQTILPTQSAFRIDYFDRRPEMPIALLLVSNDETYRQSVNQVGHARQAEYSGLYAREQRTVLVNLSTGAGTLAHELTHALAHADFPDMPEWFDEGLASLHEDAEFSADRLHLLGQNNWRLRYLQEADERGCWKTLSELWQRRFGEPDIAALDYALARNFCLYLQQRDLLSTFYRKCRFGIPVEAALEEVFPGNSLEQIDRDFRLWVRRLNTRSSSSSEK